MRGDESWLIWAFRKRGTLIGGVDYEAKEQLQRRPPSLGLCNISLSPSHSTRAHGKWSEIGFVGIIIVWLDIFILLGQGPGLATGGWLVITDMTTLTGDWEVNISTSDRGETAQCHSGLYSIHSSFRSIYRIIVATMLHWQPFQIILLIIWISVATLIMSHGSFLSQSGSGPHRSNEHQCNHIMMEWT